MNVPTFDSFPLMSLHPSTFLFPSTSMYPFPPGRLTISLHKYPSLPKSIRFSAMVRTLNMYNAVPVSIHFPSPYSYLIKYSTTTTQPALVTALFRPWRTGRWMWLWIGPQQHLKQSSSRPCSHKLFVTMQLMATCSND